MGKPSKFWLEGLVAATFTPFDEHGELNLPKIEEYCTFLLKNNIHHIYVNGTTGEGASLSAGERKQIVEKWISVAKGKLSITVHVGSINVKESKELKDTLKVIFVNSGPSTVRTRVSESLLSEFSFQEYGKFSIQGHVEICIRKFLRKSVKCSAPPDMFCESLNNLQKYLRKSVKCSAPPDMYCESLNNLQKHLELANERGWTGGSRRAFIRVSGVTRKKDIARHAQTVGADAIGALPSLFFKPQSIDALVDYCRLIAAEAPDLPFYYYHLPVFTGVELNMEDFLTQAKDKIPSLVGIKFSSKDLVDMIGCVHVDGGRFNILYGCDEQLMAGFVMGAHGAVGSLHNFIPHVYQRMIKNLEDGDLKKAREEQIKGQRTCRILYKYGALLGGNVAALKYYMPLVGLDMGPPRQPMRKMEDHELENFRTELDKIGFFNWH